MHAYSYSRTQARVHLQWQSLFSMYGFGALASKCSYTKHWALYSMLVISSAGGGKKGGKKGTEEGGKKKGKDGKEISVCFV